MTDKNDGKPVFDEQSEGYKDRARIEKSEKHMRLMWANGMTPPGTRPGNLSVEWCNAEIKHCHFKLGMQNLSLMYQRSVVIALMINIKKWDYWKLQIKKESEANNNSIYTEMKMCVKRLFGLDYIFDNKSVLIPWIKVEQKVKNARIKALVLEDDLVFKDKYEQGAPTVVQLLNWFRINRPHHKVNAYNNDILLSIFQDFGSRYKKQKISRKLHSMGIYFDNSK